MLELGHMMDMNGQHGKLKAIAIVAILLASGLAITPFIVQKIKPTNESSGSSWYNADWKYKKSVNITNPVLDYQMKIIIGYSSGGDVNLSGKCRSNFGDVRFVNSSDTTELPYWLETKTDGVNATFWVKTDNASSLFIYYGNTEATTTSNGNNTFLVFSDGSDEASWTNTVDNSNGELYFHFGGYSCARKTVSVARPYVIEAKWREETGTKVNVYFVTGDGSGTTFPSNLDADVFTDPFSYGTYWHAYCNSTVYTILASGMALSTYYIIKEICIGSDNYDHYLYNASRVLLGSLTGTAHALGTEVDPITSICFGSGSSTFSINCYVSWIFIRKYAATEPSFSGFGGEQLGSAKWYNSNWRYCKQITIDHTKVAGNLTNFPVLFSNISADLKRAQSTGNDFVFVDAINTTKYNHEIESFNSSTGELVAWINVTSLSSVNDTIIYLYYGNPTCSNQQNVLGTWDSNYVLVMHLAEDPAIAGSNGIKDSSGYYNNGTDYGGILKVTGKIGGAMDFDGSSGYINIPDSASLDAFTSCTLELWGKPDTTNFAMPLGKYRDSTGADLSYRLMYSHPDLGTGTIEIAVFNQNSPGSNWMDRRSTSAQMFVGAWSQLMGLWDGGGTPSALRLYINGSNLSATSSSETGDFTAMSNSAVSVKIGCGNSAGTNTYWFDGMIDEVRISKTARTEPWISTEYNNTNSSSTFMTLGNEQTNWYNTSFLYRKKITIDHNKVDADLTNFPVLVSTTMNTTKIQSTGNDVFFTSSSGTKLNHEIDSYNSTSGALVAWVNVTYIAGGSTTPDTYIYLYYGNMTCSSQQNVLGTWNSDYIIVNHLADTSGTNIVDSTSKNHNGTSSGTPTLNQTGLFGKAISFDGSNDYINYGDHADFSPTQVTFYFIVKTPDAQINADAVQLAKENSAAKEHQNNFNTATNKIRFEIAGSGGGTVGRKDSNGMATLGTEWSQLVLVWTGGTTDASIKIYINGVQTDDADEHYGTFTGWKDTAAPLVVGTDVVSPTEYAWKGVIDEFRFSSIARTSQWISTEYKNQNDPANFTIYSTEEQYGGAGESNTAPGTPTILGPTTRQVAPTVTIYATATDPEGDAITMYFYNNATQAEIGHQAGASGSNISISWSGLSQGTSYSFYTAAFDSQAWSANSTVCTFTANAPPAITGLMTENLTDPNRITSFIPYFNWTYTDNNSDTQAAYQIQVGTTQNGSNLWDSGNVTSASNNVKYNGTSLSRSTLYYVRIRAYDGYEWNSW